MVNKYLHQTNFSRNIRQRKVKDVFMRHGDILRDVSIDGSTPVLRAVPSLHHIRLTVPCLIQAALQVGVGRGRAILGRAGRMDEVRHEVQLLLQFLDPLVQPRERDGNHGLSFGAFQVTRVVVQNFIFLKKYIQLAIFDVSQKVH